MLLLRRSIMRLPGVITLLMRATVFLVLLAALSKASGFGSLIGEAADMVSLAILIGSVAFFLPLCLISQRYLPAFIVASIIIAMLCMAHIGFVRKSGSATNFNAIFAYFPALSFLALARSGIAIDRSLRYLVWLSAGYVLLYTLGYQQIVAAAQSAGSAILKIGDHDRGMRVLFAPAFATFLFFFMQEWRRGSLLIRAPLMMLSVTALLISNYRTFLAIFVLVALLRSVRLINPLVRWGIFGVVTSLYILLLAGLLIPQWEPFAYFADDGSGFARLLAYRHITPFILDNWQMGVGLAGSNQALQAYLRVPTFYSVYPTDLGPIGPLFMFGIGGLILYFFLTWFVIVQRLPIRFGSTHPERMALHMTALVCGVQGVISPSFMIENNSLFPAFMFAGWLQLRRLRGARGHDLNPLAFKPDAGLDGKEPFLVADENGMAGRKE